MVFDAKNVTNENPLIQLLIKIKHKKYGNVFRLDKLSHLHVSYSYILKTVYIT